MITASPIPGLPIRLVRSIAVLAVASSAPLPSVDHDPEIAPGRPLRSGAILEIHLDHQVCGRGSCSRVVTILHQGGGASREFRSGANHDSTRVSSIDSLRFERLAVRTWGAGFTSGRRVRSVSHPPLAGESWLLSLVTRNGPTTRSFLPTHGSLLRVPFVIQDVQRTVDSLRWTVPK
jgi:hypothetical protein